MESKQTSKTEAASTPTPTPTIGMIRFEPGDNGGVLVFTNVQVGGCTEKATSDGGVLYACALKSDTVDKETGLTTYGWRTAYADSFLEPGDYSLWLRVRPNDKGLERVKLYLITGRKDKEEQRAKQKKR